MRRPNKEDYDRQTQYYTCLEGYIDYLEGTYIYTPAAALATQGAFEKAIKAAAIKAKDKSNIIERNGDTEICLNGIRGVSIRNTGAGTITIKP